MQDPYLSPGKKILENKLGITSQKDLDGAEADYVSLRLRELMENPLTGDYDLEHYKRMHRYIFQDLYDWAGEFRCIDMEKEEPSLGGLSIEYAKKADIEENLGVALAEMRSIVWEKLAPGDFSRSFSACLAKIWKIHPFREGNTRTAITFCCQFIDSRGFIIDRSIFETNSVYVRTALVAYNATFHDLGDFAKKEYLEKIVYDALFGRK